MKDIVCKIVCLSLIFFLPRLSISKEFIKFRSVAILSEPHAEALRETIKNTNHQHFPDIESPMLPTIPLYNEPSIMVEGWYRMPYNTSDYISIPLTDGGIPVYGSDQYWGLQIVYTIPQEEGTYTFEESFTSSRESSNRTIMGTFSTWKTICTLYIEDGDKKTSWEVYEYYWDYPSGHLFKKWEVSGWNDGYWHEIVFYKTYTALQEDWFGVWPVEIKINGVVARERKIYTRGLTIKWKENDGLSIEPKNFRPGGDREVEIKGTITALPASGDATWEPDKVNWQLQIYDEDEEGVDESQEILDNTQILWYWNGILSNDEFASSGPYSVTARAKETMQRVKLDKKFNNAFTITLGFDFSLNYEIEKNKSENKVAPGETIIYKIGYRCDYEGGAEDVEISCIIPQYTEFVENSCFECVNNSCTPKPPTTMSSTKLEWGLGDVEYDENLHTITFQVKVDVEDDNTLPPLPRELESLMNEATLTYTIGKESEETLKASREVPIDRGELEVKFEKRSLKPNPLEEPTSTVTFTLKIVKEIKVPSAVINNFSLEYVQGDKYVTDIGDLSEKEVTTGSEGTAKLIYTAPSAEELIDKNFDLDKPIYLTLKCKENDTNLNASDTILIGEGNLKGTVYDAALNNFLNWKGSGIQHTLVMQNLKVSGAEIKAREIKEGVIESETDWDIIVSSGAFGKYELYLELEKEYKIEVSVKSKDEKIELTYKEEIDTSDGKIPENPHDFRIPISLLEEQEELINTLINLKISKSFLSDLLSEIFPPIDTTFKFDMGTAESMVDALQVYFGDPDADEKYQYHGLWEGSFDTEEEKKQRDLWNGLIRLIAFEAALKLRFDDYVQMTDALVSGLVNILLGTILEEAVLRNDEWKSETFAIKIKGPYEKAIKRALNGGRGLFNGIYLKMTLPAQLRRSFPEITKNSDFRKYYELGNIIVATIANGLTDGINYRGLAFEVLYQSARTAGISYYINKGCIPYFQEFLDDMMFNASGINYFGSTKRAVHWIDFQNDQYNEYFKKWVELLSKSGEQAYTVYKSLLGLGTGVAGGKDNLASLLKTNVPLLKSLSVTAGVTYGALWILPPHFALPYVEKNLQEMLLIANSGEKPPKSYKWQSVLPYTQLYTLWAPTSGKIYPTEITDYNSILFQIILMLTPENRDRVEELTSHLMNTDVTLSDSLDEMYHRLSACSWTIEGINPLLDFSGGASSAFYQSANLDRAMLYSLLYIWLSDPKDEETRKELIAQANDTIWSNSLAYLGLDFNNLQLLPVLAPPFLVVTNIEKPALSAGGEATLTVTIKNKGDEAANGVTATLLTGDQETIVTSSEVIVGEIRKDEEKIVSWEVSSNGAKQGDVLYFQVLLEGEDLLPKEEMSFIIVE